MTRVVYLDHHATTPLDPRVLEVMNPFFLEHFGNPASRNHRWGWEAKAAVEEARAELAETVGSRPEDLIFTSGATEALNIAIFGLAAARPQRDHIIATSVEHRAVLEPLEELGRRGYRIELLPVDGAGRVSEDQVAAALTERTLCACFLHGNNEVGTILPTAALAAPCRRRGVPVVIDACQSVGHVPVRRADVGADLLAFSGHKFHGPKGVGALVLSDNLELVPIQRGGGHERGLRPGTPNVPCIVGMAAALRFCLQEMTAVSPRIAGLRDELETELLSTVPEAHANGDRASRLPGNLNMTFPGVEAESVLISMPEIALSTGSACSSARLHPSHVLSAMGLDPSAVHASIRFGLGRGTTREDIRYVAGRVAAEVERLRKLSPSWVSRTRGRDQVVERPRTLVGAGH